jgi:hypothetical protein
MVKPLWNIKSGRFAGWRNGDFLHNSDGDCVGFFHGDIAYTLAGEYVGEIVDEDWIGKRSGMTRPDQAMRGGTSWLLLEAHPDRAGKQSPGWEDPGYFSSRELYQRLFWSGE